MVWALAMWRKRESFPRLSTVANHALMTVGALLLLMQLHGYQHDSDPDSFRFPSKEHQHEHEDLDIQKSTQTGRESL